MRQTMADELAQHHRKAIKEALRVRKRIDEKLAANITKDALSVRKGTTAAVQLLTEQAEKLQANFLKITVGDDYQFSRYVSRDMFAPLK